MSTSSEDPTEESFARWFAAGARAFISLPAFILMAAFIGFGGLAHASGVTLAQSVAMTGTIWALPSMVVLVGAIKAGTPILATAIAVSLSAVRLMPMTMALTPVLRDDRTPKWLLYGAAHFVAVTAWVFGMTKLPSLPRAARMPYFLGFAVTLTMINMVVTAVSWTVSAELPPVAASALVLLTPLYFIVSLWRAAERAPTDRVALIIGMAIMPAAHHLSPEFSLLITGLLGGTAAFALTRFLDRRRAAVAAGPAGRAADIPADLGEEER